MAAVSLSGVPKLCCSPDSGSLKKLQASAAVIVGRLGLLLKANRALHTVGGDSPTETGTLLELRTLHVALRDLRQAYLQIEQILAPMRPVAGCFDVRIDERPISLHHREGHRSAEHFVNDCLGTAQCWQATQVVAGRPVEGITGWAGPERRFVESTIRRISFAHDYLACVFPKFVDPRIHAIQCSTEATINGNASGNTSLLSAAARLSFPLVLRKGSGEWTLCRLDELVRYVMKRGELEHSAGWNSGRQRTTDALCWLRQAGLLHLKESPTETRREVVYRLDSSVSNVQWASSPVAGEFLRLLRDLSALQLSERVWRSAVDDNAIHRDVSANEGPSQTPQHATADPAKRSSGPKARAGTRALLRFAAGQWREDAGKTAQQIVDEYNETKGLKKPMSVESLRKALRVYCGGLTLGDAPANADRILAAVE